MRGRLIVPVVLGLALMGPSAMADRYQRDHHQREPAAKPDRMDRSGARVLPGPTDDARVSAAATRLAIDRAARSIPRSGSTFTNAARGKEMISARVNLTARVNCSPADDCGMSKGGAQAAIDKAAHSRGRTHSQAINNARGKELISKRVNLSGRVSCNEADECTMSAASAKIEVQKAGASQARSGTTMINNARGKELISARVNLSARVNCNEADECTMGAAGARAEWQKAGKH